MAKRIEFSQHGGPEVLRWVEFDPAPPGPQQVRVRNQAVGLNFIDTYFRGGLYAPPSLPSGLGTEGAGVVESRQWARGSAGCRSATGWPMRAVRWAPTAKCTPCRKRTWSSCRRASASSRPPPSCSRA